MHAPAGDGNGNAVFNVSRDELKRIVEAAINDSLSDVSVDGQEPINGFKGYAAEKALPIIAYRTTGGSSGRITLFAKHICEGPQYRFLIRHGIPVPRIHGIVNLAKDDEVIFMERLTAIGIDENDPAEVRQYIGVLAMINAIRPLPDEPWQPPPHAAARCLSNGEWIPKVLKIVWQHAHNGELGDEIGSLCSDSSSQLDEACRKSIAVGKLLEQGPRAVLYEDYGERNTGWRNGDDGRREFVTFDVHRLSQGPRFWDFSAVAGEQEGASFKVVSWEERVDYYLEMLARHGGPRATIADFECEQKLIRVAAAFDSLYWQAGKSISGEVDWTNDREEGRRTYRGWLLGNLQRILAFRVGDCN